MPNMSGLTPFPKGVSGNPNGRPKGKSTAKILQEMLEKNLKDPIKNPITGENSVITVREAMLLKQIAQALQGDQKSFEKIFDRFEGKPKQVIDQTNTNVNIDTVLKELEDEK